MWVRTRWVSTGYHGSIWLSNFVMKYTMHVLWFKSGYHGNVVDCTILLCHTRCTSTQPVEAVNHCLQLEKSSYQSLMRVTFVSQRMLLSRRWVVSMLPMGKMTNTGVDSMWSTVRVTVLLSFYSYCNSRIIKFSANGKFIDQWGKYGSTKGN